MIVDVAVCLSGRYVAEFEYTPLSVTEVEDIVRWTIEQLGTHCAEQFHAIRRADGADLFGEHSFEVVENLHDWEVAEMDSDGGEEPIEYIIGRYVAVTENTARFLNGKRVTGPVTVDGNVLEVFDR